jgi:crotonobetainyl-CoA:carnitine CoA-transferase CaiB-like acyl-CoA transferase
MPADVTASPTPLSGVRVVEHGASPAVAMCGKLLAELGASVSIVGGGSDTRFGTGRLARATSLFLDRGKGGASAAEFETLIGETDILLADHLSGDADALRQVAPQLILAHFTKWGEQGPKAGRPSSELVAQAAGGLLALLGEPTREPLMLAGRQAAYSAGFLGFSAVMAALSHRDQLVRQGKPATGQRIELSDLEAIAFLEWKGPVYYQASGALVPRGKENGPLVLPCADGHFAFFYSPPDWPAIVEMFGSLPALADERFATSAGRIAGEAELKSILSDLTRNRAKHELYHMAQARGVPAGAVETIADLRASPQYAATSFLRPLPGGAEPSLPFTFNGVRPAQSFNPVQ